MSIRRNIPSQSFVQHNLAERIGQMVVTADNMVDAHIVVVNNNRKHIRRRTVRTNQNHIVQLVVRNANFALNQIVKNGFAFARSFDSDNGLDAFRRFGRIAVAPTAVITNGLARRLLFFAHLSQFFRRTITIIRFTLFQQLMSNFHMTRSSGKLKYGFGIPIYAQPFQAFKNRVNRSFRRTFAVRVLDAQVKLAAAMARIQPVKQRRTGSPDVQIPRR